MARGRGQSAGEGESGEVALWPMRERRSRGGGGATGRAPAYEGVVFGPRGRSRGELAKPGDFTIESIR